MTQPTVDISKLSPEQKRQLLANLLKKKAAASAQADGTQSATNPTDTAQPLIQATALEGNELESPADSQGSGIQRFPLSFAQQRLWFIDQLQLGTSVYTIPAVLHLKGALQAEVLERSLNGVVSRHESLRTTFIEIDGQPFQQIVPQLHVPLERLDWSNHLPETTANQASTEELDPALEAKLRQLIAQPFELSHGPLLRSHLISLSPTEHLLVVALHHIIADYWSLKVMMGEIAVLYRAIAQGLQDPLIPLQIQYVDFAAWQRQQLATTATSLAASPNKLQAQLDFWTQQLSGPVPMLQLSTDFPRPAVQSFRGTRYSFRLPQQLSKQLVQLAKQEQVTPFMLLLAAFKTLLYRYTGQTDLWVGSTVTNRDRPELQNLIGLFVNNLVFRSQLSPDQTFHAFLQQVRETTLDAYGNQDLPFEKIVEVLQTERQLSHNALFQVMFILHNTPSESLTLPELAVTALKADNASARFDLSLDMYETETGFTGVFEYSIDLFKASTIERLAGHLEQLLSSIVAEPQQSLSCLGLLTAAEQEQLNQWGSSSDNWANSALAPGQAVTQLITEQAELRGDAIAISDDTAHSTGQLTYAALEQQSNQLAHYLRNQGLKAGDRVGICLPRTVKLVVSLLAVLKIGASYIPLDPLYPQARLRYVLEDAQALWLITSSKIAETLDVHHWNVANNFQLLDLESSASEIGQQLTQLIEPTPAPEQIAYIIYTSGSTGKPKGVPIRHGSLSNFLISMAQRPGLAAGDRLLAVTTVAFDIAALELFLPLTIGAQLVLATAEVARDAEQLAAQLERDNITVMQATPSTWRLLFSQGWTGASGLKVLCGGEALDLPLAQQLLQSCGQLWNMYGPTETTIWSAALQLTEASLSDGVVPFGGPIAQTELQVLDHNFQSVPIGVPGELHIAGAGLSPGYLNRERLSQERFIQVYKGTETSKYFYKTGDLVRYQDNGTLEYLGRLDNQIKLRGFRIELGEIEAAIATHPQVEQAIVILNDAEIQNPYLIAYFIPSNASAEAATSLRAHLLKRLPSYMLPNAFIGIEQLPLTANGKVDRNALKQSALYSEQTAQRAAASGTAPQGETERKLAEIWSKILNQDVIHQEDNFFELGGHSLLATRVIAQVRQQLGLEVPLRSLFEQSTLAAFATAVDSFASSQQNVPSQKRLPSIPKAARDQSLPLSFAQQRQWVLNQLAPESSRYAIPAAIELNGEFSLPLLKQSLAQVVARHESLRTVFVEVDGVAVQQVQAEMAIAPVQEDLSQIEATEQQAQVRQRLQALISNSFNLSQGPLLRLQVLKLSQTRHVLLLVMHHIISDAWSVGILVQELTHAYATLAQGQKLAWAELPLQYADYAIWQRQWLSEPAQAQQLDYWKQQLADLPPLLELPTDHARPAVQGSQGAVHEFRLTTAQIEALEGLGQRQGATLFMTLLTAFQLLLSRYSSSTDIAIGTPIANRRQAELEGLIGMFVNTLVLRSDLSGNPSFEELLGRVKQTALDAYEHQDIPFEQVVDALELPRSWSHSPLFQVMFILQEQSQASQELAGLDWQPLSLKSGTAKFDLTLTLRRDLDGFSGVFEYRTDLFEADTMARMAGHFTQLLTSILDQPQQPIAELNLLTPAEQQQLAHWNQPQLADLQPSSAQALHHLFEAQVARSPNAVALRHDQQTLTYSQLNQRANQLAHYLQSLGVQPETRIGICMARSPELLIAILAVLKSGAAYVPLDPAYPQARLQLILQDAQVEQLLTQSHCQVAQNLNAEAEHSAGQAPALSVLNLDCLPELAQQSTDNPVRSIHAQNLAYVIYTSGSTGRPKGVAIEHRSPIALVNWAKTVFSDEMLKAVLASTSICFDLSIFEFFVPLSLGGSIVLVDNVLELAELTTDVSLINTVPSAAQALLRIDGIPSTVKTINLAGEPLSQALVSQLYQLPQVQQVFNLYGPSEDTTYSTFSAVKEIQNVTIGRPISQSQAYVLDRNRQPVPIGVPGELYLGGAGLARGYLNRPELTSERFIPNPFAVEASGSEAVYSEAACSNNIHSERLYRTGDRVRYLANGELEYLDRLDHQVKVRGFRIELGEIETALSQQEQVDEVLVIARALKEEIEDHQQLIAHIVCKRELVGETSDLAATLKSCLAETLPDYMIPAHVVMLESMPLLPNGKRDRKSLPAPTPAPPSTSPARQPQNELQKKLVALWIELLGISQIGLDDNFFELGGDSILAIQFIAKARQLGVQFTPKDLFQHQTIAALGAIASDRTHTETLGASQARLTGPIALTPIQRWFWEQSFAEPHHWNQSLLLSPQQPLEPELLQQALSHLVTHHDGLRLSFSPSAVSSPAHCDWQQSYGSAAVTLVSIEELEVTLEDYEAVIEKTAQGLQSRFDLANGPLFKVAYFQFKDSQRLLLVCHHLIIDGISWRILLGDLQVLYRQLSQSQASQSKTPQPISMQLPAKTTSLQYWAQQLVDYASSDTLETELDYWRNIAAPSIVPLPRNRATAPEESTKQTAVNDTAVNNTGATLASVSISLSSPETAQLLQDASAAYQTQINDLLLTALAIAFQNWTHQPQLRLELEGHGREALFPGVDLSRTIGWFTSLFPVLLDLNATNQQSSGRQLNSPISDAFISAAIKQTKETLRAIPNRGIGYGILRYLKGDASLVSPSEVRFNYLGQTDQLLGDESWLSLATESSGMARSPRNHRTVLLEINAWVKGGELQLNWLYSNVIHQPETIQALADDVLRILKQIIHHCRSTDSGGFTPSDFPQMQLGQGELDDLLDDLEEDL